MLLLPLQLTAAPIIGEERILNQKTVTKITEIDAELREKTGITMLLGVFESSGKSSKELREMLQNEAEGSFGAVLFVKEQRKIDVFGTPDVEAMVDKQVIYWDYIIPILPKKLEDLHSANISAALLSGYSKMAQEVARAQDKKLTSGVIDIEADHFSRYVNYTLIALLLTLFAIIGYVFVNRRK